MLERRRGVVSQKLGWLLFTRLGLALLSIALIASTAGEGLRKSSYYPAYTLLVIVCFADLLYLIYYRLHGSTPSFVMLQIGLDVLFVTLLIFLSGASKSSFSFFYYAVVLAAANLISRRSALFFASLSTMLLAAVTLSYYFASEYGSHMVFLAPEWVRMANLDLNSALVYLAGQGVALHLVGLLAGQLVARAADVRALYGRILDDMNQGILVLAPDAHILYANSEAARLLSSTQASRLVGTPLSDVLSPTHESKIRQMIGTSGPAMTEMQFGAVGTGVRNVEVKTSVLRNSRDDRIGAIVLITDLALRRRLEESQKRVERLQEIEEMSTGLAHEIRNPLASIRGCTQELGKRQFDSDTNQKLAQIVCRESDRLDKIVNDFLNMARMKPPVFGRTELDTLIEEVVILLRSREDVSEIRILNEVKNKIHVYCDSEQIRQMLLNLGINAIEALDGHGYIHFSAARAKAGSVISEGKGILDPESDGYVIEVEDNGKGIGPEDKPKIFTPFFTTKQKGTGMGLAIVSRIVVEHDGLLEIDSEPGKGTTVRVWLPLNPRTAKKRGELSWMQP
jgi:two-component system sensor histidine kinase PilS (NtrC family)